MEIPYWFPVVTTLIGTLAGFALVLGKDWWARRQRRRAHWAALSAEVEQCRRCASAYLNDPVAAPLYRLLTMAFERSFPPLLADAAVSEHEMEALLAFYSEVQTLNRGLDLAQGARQRNDTAALTQEVQRNVVKARRLTVNDADPNYYIPIRSMLNKRLGREAEH